MKMNVPNIEKVNLKLEAANLPTCGAISRTDVAQWPEIKSVFETSLTVKETALSLALQYGVSTIEYWEPITAEDFAERLNELMF